MVQPCRLVLPFSPVCPPPWHTTLPHCAHITALLISLISLAVLSHRSLCHAYLSFPLSNSLSVHVCECLLRLMALTRQSQPVDVRTETIAPFSFSVFLNGIVCLEWWNVDVSRKDGKSKCQEKMLKKERKKKFSLSMKWGWRKQNKVWGNTQQKKMAGLCETPHIPF